MLSGLTFIQVLGPLLTFAPAERLNLLTGDNGLGKTLVLDTTWWALTNNWAGRPVRPRQGHASEGQINISQTEAPDTASRCRFNTRAWKWAKPGRRPATRSPVLYFRADGSAAVFDPARNLVLSESDLPERVVESHSGEGYALHNATLEQLRTVLQR